MQQTKSTEESNLPAPNLSFEQKLRNKIRESIGDLMSEEDLKKLCDKGLNEMLFQPRTRPDPDRSYNTITIPPLMHEILQDALKDQIKEQVKAYVLERQDDVMTHVEHMLKEGAGKAVLAAVSSMFDQAMRNFKCELANDMRNHNYPFE